MGMSPRYRRIVVLRFLDFSERPPFLLFVLPLDVICASIVPLGQRIQPSSAAMNFSIVIPARDEEAYIGACLESIEAAALPYPGLVEIIVALNRCTDRTEEIALKHGALIVHDDRKNLAMIRNTAARQAHGEILVTIDADSAMTPNMLTEIDRLLASGKYIGGGSMIYPERMSPGIFLTLMLLAPLVLRHRVSAGLFWCFRKDFEAIRGFNERWISAEDIEFARRLKAYGKAHGKGFKTIWKAHIRTSCRKFDKFGDWYLLKNPRLVRDVLGGKSQEAADGFFYDFER